MPDKIHVLKVQVIQIQYNVNPQKTRATIYNPIPQHPKGSKPTKYTWVEEYPLGDLNLNQRVASKMLN